MRAMMMTLALLPGLAAAQTGLDAHDLYLAPQQGGAFTVLSPTAFEKGAWYASGLFEYGNDVLVLHQVLDNGEEREVTALGGLGALNLGAGYALHERVRLEIAMPVVPMSSGLDGSNGFALGDLRMGVTVPVFQSEGLGVAVAPWLDLPTGDEVAFLGRAGVGGGLKAAAAYQAGDWTLAGSAGMALQKAMELKNLNGADQVQLGLSAAWAATEKRGLTAELLLAPATVKNVASGAGFPAEARLASRHGVSDGSHVVWGVAKGVSAGVGAADWRLFLGGGFGSHEEAAPAVIAAVVDADQDGIEDGVDACPAEAENKNGYKDEDGCPDVNTKLAVSPMWEGKPLSGAAVSVKLGSQAMDFTSGASAWTREALDVGAQVAASASYKGCLFGEASAAVAEGENTLSIPMIRKMGQVKWDIRKPDGTPLTGATVTFQGAGSDPCVPTEAFVLAEGKGTQDVGLGERVAVVSAPGFKAVQIPVTVLAERASEPAPVTLDKTQLAVKNDEIATLEPVYFDTSKASIQDRSFALLDEMAATLIAHPQWTAVEIGGHTDADGDDAMNLDLSQRRATEVRAHLVQKGVEAARLTAKGYGETVPVGPNDTAANKAKNRRVEFKIVTSR